MRIASRTTSALQGLCHKRFRGLRRKLKREFFSLSPAVNKQTSIATGPNGTIEVGMNRFSEKILRVA